MEYFNNRSDARNLNVLLKSRKLGRCMAGWLAMLVKAENGFSITTFVLESINGSYAGLKLPAAMKSSTRDWAVVCTTGKYVLRRTE